MEVVSEKQVTVVQALAAVMEDVREVRKDDRNQQQGYAFRGIDAVVNACGPALRRHGVVVVPLLEEVNYRDVQTSTGKPSRECTVKVRYRFYGPSSSGDFIDCVTPGESMDFGDKGAPKAMSVAFRIALLQALCLPTDDPDPDAQSYERSAQSVRADQDRVAETPRAEAPPVGKAVARLAIVNSLESLANFDQLAEQYYAAGEWSQEDFYEFTRAAESARVRLTPEPVTA